MYRKASQIEQACQKLSCQHPPEIARNAEVGNGSEDKGKAQQLAQYIDNKNPARHTQSLQNAGQGGVQIDKGADEAQGGDKISCKVAVKKRCSCPFSEKEETEHAGKAHQKTIFHGFAGGFPDSLEISQCIIFGNNGKKKYGNGIGQGIWKKNQRHGHAGEYPVDT